MSVLADLVSANVTSTGTGTLTLGSVVTGCLPFSVLPDGSIVTYGLTNGSQYEIGIGTIGNGGTTLTRSLRTSSTGSLLNVSAGANVSIVIGAFDIPPQANMSATADPTATDDASQGFSVGSFWFRASTGQLWICRNATTGNAIWTPISGTGIGKQTIYVPASAMTPRVTAGPSIGALETATNKINLVTLDFDPVTQESAQFSVAMPASWDEGQISFEVLWYHPSTTTNFGVVWAVEAVSLSDNNALDTAFGSPVLISDTGGSANTLYDSPESSLLTVGNSPAENDTLIFQVYRVPANASDTLAVDARLIGVRVFYSTNTNTDSPSLVNNFTANSVPTASNDQTQGYAVGSQWLWAARGLSWTCVDSTTGAAVWLINSNNYPTGLFAPREQSWIFDRNVNIAHANGSGPWGGRWFINTNATLSIVGITNGNGRVGLRRSTTGTGFGSITAQSGQQSINADGGATWRWKSRINLRPGTQAAPTVAEDYRYLGGFTDNFGSLTPNQSAFFAYYQSGGTVFFEARSRRNAGTVQVTSLTLPNADQWLTLEIILTPTQVRYLVEGVVVATHTTIPTSVVFDGDDWRGIAGTSTRNFDLSFLAVAVNWGTDS